MTHYIEGLAKIEVKSVDLLAGLNGWGYKVEVYNKVSEGGAALEETRRNTRRPFGSKPVNDGGTGASVQIDAVWLSAGRMPDAFPGITNDGTGA